MQDLRHALRQLRRRPVFAATAIVTLAIGLGVNAVAFTVVNGLLFKGWSGKANADVGRVLVTPGGDEGGYGSLPDFERFTAATRGSLDLAAEGRSSLTWRHDGVAETAWVLFVTPNYFSMIDAPLVLGQPLVARAENGPPMAVIGERFWRESLGSTPLAGLSLRLNKLDVAVSGIVAESFTGPAGLYSPDVWLPLDDLDRFGTPPQLRARETRWLFFFGRPRPGSSPAAVQGQLDVASADMARDWPDSHRGRGARFRLFSEGNREHRRIRTGAAIGMGLIGLVLLLACFNVATLLLARAVERERDMGIRAALGGGPARLMRLVLTEGFVIAGLAAVLAIGVASWTQSLIGSFEIPIEQPQHIDFTLDARVVAFIVGLACVAGVLPGLWPAISAGRVDVLRVLRSQGGNAASGRPSPMRRWLVGAQIAGSTAFLAIAALLIQSVSYLKDTDYGFDHRRLVVADVTPGSSGLDRAASERYVNELVARAAVLPGVASVAVVDHAPFFIGFDRLTPVWPAGVPCDGDACPKVATIAAGPGYFKTMGIEMAAGREFDAAGPATEVIVNQPFATQQWPDGRGLGETLRLGERGTIATVVGVAAKHHTRGLDREQPTLYVPLGKEHFDSGLTVVVRTAADPAPAIRGVMEAARAVDPDVSLTAVKTMRERMAVQLWPFNTMRRVFAICGALAMLLATVGLASVVIHSVSRRLREFGVRASIGASPRDLRGHVLRDVLRLFAPGLVAGLVLAVGAARLVQVVFIGVDVLNPVTYLAVALVECAIVLVACLGPARRASRVDPLIALRSE